MLRKMNLCSLLIAFVVAVVTQSVTATGIDYLYHDGDFQIATDVMGGLETYSTVAWGGTTSQGAAAKPSGGVDWLSATGPFGSWTTDSPTNWAGLLYEDIGYFGPTGSGVGVLAAKPGGGLDYLYHDGDFQVATDVFGGTQTYSSVSWGGTTSQGAAAKPGGGVDWLSATGAFGSWTTDSPANWAGLVYTDLGYFGSTTSGVSLLGVKPGGGVDYLYHDGVDFQVATDVFGGTETYSTVSWGGTRNQAAAAKLGGGVDWLSADGPFGDWITDSPANWAGLLFEDLGFFGPSSSGVGVFGVPAVPPTVEWSVDASGDWNDSTSWGASLQVPNSNSQTVIFGSVITQSRTVVVDSAVTVKGVQFNNANSYAIAGLGSVDLEADTGNASIDVALGSHQFQAVVNLNSETDVSVASGETLTFNNALNIGANNLNKTGVGTLQINNAQNTGSGTLNATAGIVSGAGLVSGDLNNSGATVAPGNSPGTLSVGGNYSQSAGSLAIEIGGLNTVGNDPLHDVLSVAGSLTISGGSLDVVLINGYVPSLGDTFDILDFATIDLSGATLNLDTLAAGLIWDSSQLTFDGSLSVISDLLGDFDTDGDVDGNDFLTWQRGFGTSFDSTDLTDWENNFGSVLSISAISSSTAAVPEPTCFVLLLTAVTMVVGRRR